MSLNFLDNFVRKRKIHKKSKNKKIYKNESKKLYKNKNKNKKLLKSKNNKNKKNFTKCRNKNISIKLNINKNNYIKNNLIEYHNKDFYSFNEIICAICFTRDHDLFTDDTNGKQITFYSETFYSEMFYSETFYDICIWCKKLNVNNLSNNKFGIYYKNSQIKLFIEYFVKKCQLLPIPIILIEKIYLFAYMNYHYIYNDSFNNNVYIYDPFIRLELIPEYEKITFYENNKFIFNKKTHKVAYFDLCVPHDEFMFVIKNNINILDLEKYLLKFNFIKKNKHLLFDIHIIKFLLQYLAHLESEIEFIIPLYNCVYIKNDIINRESEFYQKYNIYREFEKPDFYKKKILSGKDIKYKKFNKIHIHNKDCLTQYGKEIFQNYLKYIDDHIEIRLIINFIYYSKIIWIDQKYISQI